MKAVDMHCDIIVEIYKDRRRGGRQSILENQLMLDLRRMQIGDYELQNFALYTNLEQAEGNPFEFCMELLDTFYQEVEARENIIGIVRTYDDIRRDWGQGRISALFTVEKNGTCQGKTALLRSLYRLEARMMALTWNFPSELTFPNARIEGMDGTFKMAPDTEHEPTDTEVTFVEEVERPGMMIDVSHLSDAGIWDVSRYTSRPFMASRSNVRTVASHPKNLTDDMIRALAERGDAMDISYCIAFLRDFGPGGEQLDHVSDMVGHMKHIQKIGGIGCIGLGSDFDGVNGSLEVGDVEKLPVLADTMEREGFTASEIEAVFCRNALWVCRDIL